MSYTVRTYSAYLLCLLSWYIRLIVGVLVSDKISPDILINNWPVADSVCLYHV